MGDSTALARIRTEEDRLAVVDSARAMLAHACSAEQCKQVADMARAAEVYGRLQKASEEAITAATSLKIEALTRMGEILKATEKNEGAKGIGTSAVPKENRTPTLRDHGIPKKQSMHAQALVAIRDKAPEVYEQVKAGKVSVAKARVAVRNQKKSEELRREAEEVEQEDDGEQLWEVVTGDAVEKLAAVEPGSVALVFADPPYNIGFDYGAGHDDEQPDDQYLAWVEEWVVGCVQALAPDGSMWVLINDEYAAEYAGILKAAGLTRRNWVIWYETFGVNCADKFNRTKRHLFYCVKNPRRFTFNADAVSRPSDRQTKYNDARANPAGKNLDDVWLDVPRLVGTAAERVPDFPTQLPLAILVRIVACSSRRGDLVLDPFNGSGTTGVAAVELGRRYFGIERNPDYAERARQRLTIAARKR